MPDPFNRPSVTLSQLGRGRPVVRVGFRTFGADLTLDQAAELAGRLERAVAAGREALAAGHDVPSHRPGDGSYPVPPPGPDEDPDEVCRVMERPTRE